MKEPTGAENSQPSLFVLIPSEELQSLLLVVQSLEVALRAYSLEQYRAESPFKVDPSDWA